MITVAASPLLPGRPSPRWSAPASFLSLTGFKFFYLAVICAIVLPVAVSAAGNTLTGCVSNYDSNADYFPDKINDPDTTTHIQFSYSKNYKVINNTLTNEVIVLYQCGTPKPTVPANRTLPVPVSSVSIADTTMITFLELLGQRLSIKYTTGGADFIVSPCVQALKGTDNAVKDVDTNATKAIQQLQSTDVTFAYPGDMSSQANNSVAFYSTSDVGGLHHSEWLFFIAAFFNQEAQANSIFSTLASNYDCLAKAAAAQSTKPKVAIASYSAPSDFNNKTESWVLQTGYDGIAEAGGQIVTPAAGVNATKATSPVTGISTYRFSSSAALLSVIQDADILIDLTFSDVNSTEALKNFGLTATSSSYKFVANKQIFMSNKEVTAAGAQGTYEDAVVEENIVLADLISMIQPAVLPASSYTRTFYRNVFSEPQVKVTSSQCTDTKAAAPLPTVACPSGSATGSAKPNGAFRAADFGAGIAALVAGAAAMVVF